MKLLIIEDDDDLRNLLKLSLGEDGHIVEAEANGADGLSRALYQDYDLIVLDVMLPEMDGWEILECLRKRKSTPVLMLTSVDTPALRVKGLDLGSDDYMPKPFDLEELKARIRAIIRRQSGSHAPMVAITEAIDFDPKSRNVFNSGERVDMTARELNLLELFLKRRGHIIPKQKIWELISEDTDECESNMVEVYIYNLRKKFGRQMIKTHRGLGYELIKI